MRFTIERLRTLVLVAGVLLVITLGVFLGTARFRNRFFRKDLPQKLGLNIQEQGKDVVFSHSLGEHMQYKIHAAKQVQLKQNGKVTLQLHDVAIELYGEDGSLVDRIAGDEFDYDPHSGIAKADGPVEITITRPYVAPAIAPKAMAEKAIESKQMPQKLSSAAQVAVSGEIHVKTSGLVFDRNTGEASTAEKVEFTLTQGNGSALGAKYDAHAGALVLDRDVELSLQRGAEPMKLFAQHAEFDRDQQACTLKAATVRYGNDASSAEVAKVHFRNDGSAERLDAGGGFSLTTLTGGRLTAPTGAITFDEHNEPLLGHLQGGVTIDSENNGRKVHGAAPSMDLAFAAKGILRSAHLERGVKIASDEENALPQGQTRMHREWSSPVLDIAFRDAGKGKVEPGSMHGSGGVVVTAWSQRGNGPAAPEKLTADDVTGEFGPHGTLTTITGRGHTTVAETTAAGVKQSTSGDRLVAQLAEPTNAGGKSRDQGGLQIESATLDGHVLLTQQPTPKNGVAQPVVNATATHAEYGGGGQWLHLTGQPRVTDGGLELTSDKLDVSQQSGDAVASGDVKATWMGDPKKGNGSAGASPNFGAQGPTHVVAQEADLQRSTSSATFKGNVRLWQQGNSISAPVIVLDRTKQTLIAQTANAKAPVRVVLVSAAAAIPGEAAKSKEKGPSVISVNGGDLKYSGAERKAVMRAGIMGKVVVSTADATTRSNELELVMQPTGNHAGKNGAAGQIDRMTSTGDVEISSGDRRGFGKQIVYTNDTGDYVLTGTAGEPPKFTDPAHGTVTGQALIFNSRDDSVRVEGEGQKTTTATRAPK